MKKTMKIEGMMCPHCEARVKALLEGVAGVASADVSYQNGTAALTLSSAVSDECLTKVVGDGSYKVLSVSEN